MNINNSKATTIKAHLLNFTYDFSGHNHISLYINACIEESDEWIELNGYNNKFEHISGYEFNATIENPDDSCLKVFKEIINTQIASEMIESKIYLKYELSDNSKYKLIAIDQKNS
jgi:hypothetical protein